MPLVKDAPVKPFKRKEYRPWDLFGELDNPNSGPTLVNNKAEENLGQTQDKARTNLGQQSDITEKEAVIDHHEEPKKPLSELAKLSDKHNATHSPKSAFIQKTSEPIEVSASTPGLIQDDVPLKSTGKTQDKPRTNLGQSQDKHKTKSGQEQSELRTKLGQTQDKVKTEPRTNSEKINPVENFSSLIGLQRKITVFIYEGCKLFRGKITSPLSVEHIASSCKTSKLSVQKSIQRLEHKGIIFREKFKNGRGGWTQYGLPESIFQEILHTETQDKARTNLGQSPDKVKTEPRTEPRTSPPSSSSVNIKETTTTRLSEEWNFDITPYTRFGFTSSQLKQVASLGVVTATDVEQSLTEFNYDLENNALPHIKTTKINFLMGLLRAGHLYVSENFKNEQEAMIAEMARRSKAKQENLLKAKFEAWIEIMDDGQKKKIEEKMPTHLMVLYRAYGTGNFEVKNWLYDYFAQNNHMV